MIKQRTLNDLHPQQPGVAQTTPFRLSPKERGKSWAAYQAQYGLVVTLRGWVRVWQQPCVEAHPQATQEHEKHE